MSANQPALAERRPPSHRLRWILWGAAGLLVAAVLAVLLVKAFVPSGSSGSSDVTATWPAGARPAPAFALRDEHGNQLTLESLRGRPAIVTFIDPLCRDFCPREATVLSEAAAALGKDAPAIVSVSVNPWADTPANFRADAAHWRLAPGWRWGVGSYGKLADVWKRYAVAVQVTDKKIAGVKVRNIVHTGAAYLIDAKGNERALFLYPFTTDQVVSATKDMLSAGT
jgi:cytochrome oxidase Cu insertion factor (SCO1/SenC/PrrC family)